MTAGYGQASVVADTTDYNVTQLQIESALSRMQTISIAEVISCSNAGGVSPVGTVTIKILVNLMTGNGQAIPHGSIFNVPYLRAQGGGNAIILDPVAGDIGMVGFASRDISAVQSSKGQANPGSNRTFDWADAIYVSGMLNGTPTQYLQFLSSGINLLSPTLIQIIAPNITLQGATTATGPVVMQETLDVVGDMTAGSATFTGTFVQNGDGTFTGTLTGTSATFTGTVTAASFAGSGGGPGSGTVTSVTIDGVNSVSGSGTITTSGTVTLQLTNDLASPGASYYYGTNGSGVKGWYALGGGSGTVTSVGLSSASGFLTLSGTNPVTASGTIGVDISSSAAAALAVTAGLAASALQPADVANSIHVSGGDLQLVGDVASPGNNYVYGTNGSGVKGWYAAGGGGGSVSVTDGTNTVNPATTITAINGYVQSLGAGDAGLYFPWSPDMPPVTPNAMNDEFDGGTLSGIWSPFNIQSGNPLTYTIADSAITLNIPIDGGVSTRIWQGLSQPVPATPWGFIIKVRGALLTTTYNYAGFIIANSSTLQGISYGLDWHSSYGEPCFFTGASPNYTAHTTNDVANRNGNGSPIAPFGNQWFAQGSSTLTQAATGGSPIQTHWLAIVSDGTDLYFSVSMDGKNFNLLWAQTISSYFSSAPDLIVIGGRID